LRAHSWAHFHGRGGFRIVARGARLT
jgi:hypothetical protein